MLVRRCRFSTICRRHLRTLLLVIFLFSFSTLLLGIPDNHTGTGDSSPHRTQSHVLQEQVRPDLNQGAVYIHHVKAVNSNRHQFGRGLLDRVQQNSGDDGESYERSASISKSGAQGKVNTRINPSDGNHQKDINLQDKRQQNLHKKYVSSDVSHNQFNRYPINDQSGRSFPRFGADSKQDKSHVFPEHPRDSRHRAGAQNNSAFFHSGTTRNTKRSTPSNGNLKNTVSQNQGVATQYVNSHNNVANVNAVTSDRASLNGGKYEIPGQQPGGYQVKQDYFPQQNQQVLAKNDIRVDKNLQQNSRNSPHLDAKQSVQDAVGTVRVHPQYQAQRVPQQVMTNQHQPQISNVHSASKSIGNTAQHVGSNVQRAQPATVRQSQEKSKPSQQINLSHHQNGQLKLSAPKQQQPQNHPNQLQMNQGQFNVPQQQQYMLQQQQQLQHQQQQAHLQYQAQQNQHHVQQQQQQQSQAHIHQDIQQQMQQPGGQISRSETISTNVLPQQRNVPHQPSQAIRDIVWSTEVDDAVSEAFTWDEVDEWSRKVRTQQVTVMATGSESKCGRPPNHYLEMNNGIKLCARYRETHVIEIEGELLSFYLSRLMDIRSVPPLVLLTIQSQSSQWSGQSSKLTDANWNNGKIVSITQFLDGLGRALLPKTLNRGKNAEPIEANSSELQSLPLHDLTYLAQWTDLVVFDYLIGHIDRVTNHQEGESRHDDVIQRSIWSKQPIHNLAISKSTSNLWFIDNETGFRMGYRTLYHNPVDGEKYRGFHNNTLHSVCVFRRRTVQKISELHNHPNPMDLLMKMVHDHEPLAPYVRADYPGINSDLPGLFKTRIENVYRWMEQCRHRLNT